MFDFPLTEKDYYWLGYIRADGSLSPDKASPVLRFAQNLEEPVAEFAEYIGGKVYVYEQGKATYKPGSLVYSTHSSVAFARKMMHLDPKGSIIESAWLNRHFWRGFVDGDGSIAITCRGHPWLALTGTLKDMEYFSSYIETISKIKPPILVNHSIFKISITGLLASYISWYLYDGAYSAHPLKREKAAINAAWKTKFKNSVRRPIYLEGMRNVRPQDDLEALFRN